MASRHTIAFSTFFKCGRGSRNPESLRYRSWYIHTWTTRSTRQEAIPGKSSTINWRISEVSIFLWAGRFIVIIKQGMPGKNLYYQVKEDQILLNIENGIIYELKPNNPRAIRDGYNNRSCTKGIGKYG